MDTQGPNPKLIDALSQVSSLELFQLNTIIDRMLADPRRIIAVRANMHLGQTVRFLDWHDGRMRSGKVVAMRDHQMTLHETDTRREWMIALRHHRAAAGRGPADRHDHDAAYGGGAVTAGP